MNDSQNSIRHPELGPTNPAGQAATKLDATTGGEIFFKNGSDIHAIKRTLDEAIAGGDTVEKRTRNCFEAILPEQK